ncbi:hypothetical protein DL237_08080 [Pseudooceanicola sediminis]|uniref:D-galactarate dehydratase n=1 Tax=Pseudooceanicola sediminis TaxID=2211117 RepID=A0A399J3V6_9RHOB|nr:hypothetical protein [Pseudooceanicola sediminis]KAA2316196.1 hypothetical protein E0K93_04935 [Puniceibacterium sp. HSS470]RII39109.1 hypothetical protein DL237_08080 [Pseudooceanicola sediminis]
MKAISLILSIPALAITLAGCTQIQPTATPRPDAAPIDTGATAEAEILPANEAAVSVRPPEGPSKGRTVATLGAAGEPGLWLKTPMVTSVQKGRITAIETGTTITAQLIPINGPETAGSRLSLMAMQALGVPLTGLIEIDVYPGG